MKDSPCYKCSLRGFNCHSTCNRYKDYVELQKETKKNKDRFYIGCKKITVSQNTKARHSKIKMSLRVV